MTSKHFSTHLLKLAAALYSRILHTRGPLDREIHVFLRAQRHLRPHEHERLALCIDGMLRFRHLIETLAGLNEPNLLVRIYLLAVAGLDERDLPPDDPTTHRALKRLREFKEPQDPTEALALHASLPLWLLQRLIDATSAEEAPALTEALRQRPPVTVRANTLLLDRDTLQARLLDEGITSTPTPYSPVGLTLDAWAPLLKTQAFQQGNLEIQDEGSQLLSLLTGARPGQTLVDACAGAGGKTLHLAALMQNKGSLYAFDALPHRLKPLRPRARRAGVHNLHIHGSDDKDGRQRLKRLHGKADAVLVDAPCSGTGALRRNPEDAWRLQPEDIHTFANTQLQLLRDLAPLVRPGGRLVYATCSLFPEENERILEQLLQELPELSPLPAAPLLTAAGAALPPPREPGSPWLRLWPHLHNTDGFFGAVLVRS